MVTTITSVTNGCNGNRLIAAVVNGTRYNAVVGPSMNLLFEYCGMGGDSCEKTRLIQNDEILRNVLRHIGA